MTATESAPAFQQVRALSARDASNSNKGFVREGADGAEAFDSDGGIGAVFGDGGKERANAK